MFIHVLPGLFLLGSSPIPAEAGAPPDPGDPAPVYGGGPVETCGWPTTVELNGCTGTLVHPEVVIYAAHCGSSVYSVKFGDTANGSGFSVQTDFCRTIPGGGIGDGRDFAVCKLSQPVNDIAIVPPLMGCETDILQPGQEVTIVGFGNTDGGGWGVKNEVTTTINQITNNDEAYIGGGGKDSCQGDSGGPVYVQLDDGTWRVFGITSYGGACGGGGYYSMMHIGMEWFEEESGVDLTPCHDADGTWNPGPDCQGFPENPGSAGGSWAAGCNPGPLGDWSETCGDPYGMNPTTSSGGTTGDPTTSGGTTGEPPATTTDASGSASASSTTTGDPTTAGGGSSGTGEVTDAGGGTAVSATGDPGSGTDATGFPTGGLTSGGGTDDEGCACRATTSGFPAPWSLLVLVLGRRRRR